MAVVDLNHQTSWTSGSTQNTSENLALFQLTLNVFQAFGFVFLQALPGVQQCLLTLQGRDKLPECSILLTWPWFPHLLGLSPDPY